MTEYNTFFADWLKTLFIRGWQDGTARFQSWSGPGNSHDSLSNLSFSRQSTPLSTNQTARTASTRKTRSMTIAASRNSKVWSRPPPPATSTPPSETSTLSPTSPGRARGPPQTARTPATKPSASLRPTARTMSTGRELRQRGRMLARGSPTTRVSESWAWARKCPDSESF